MSGVAVDTAAFERDGIVVLPTTGERDALLDAIVASLPAGGPQDGRSVDGVTYFADRIMDAWLVNPHVRDLALAPAVLATLEALFGRVPRAFQTLNFARGTQQRAHSDAVFFASDPPGFLCAVWVALEDVDEDSGPVFYHPGSHRAFPVTRADLDTGVRYDDAHHEAMIDELDRTAARPRLGTLRKGQALLWHGSLVHGGSPVGVTHRTRHSQVTHYVFDGCRSWVPRASRPGAVRWREPTFVDSAAAGPVRP